MKNRNHARRAAIVRLVAAGGPDAASHESIRAALAAAGHVVAQPTVSRDLRALGLARGPSGWTGAPAADALTAVASVRRALEAALAALPPT